MMTKQKTLLCRNCKKETICDLKEKSVSEKVAKYTIEYLSKNYICRECYTEVFETETFDYNTKAANDEIRKQTSLIRIEEIKEIIKKYNISEKFLSLILGLDEMTITRYLAGQNPTRRDSYLLKSINEDPELYEMYLVMNIDKLATCR